MCRKHKSVGRDLEAAVAHCGGCSRRPLPPPSRGLASCVPSSLPGPWAACRYLAFLAGLRLGGLADDLARLLRRLHQFLAGASLALAASVTPSAQPSRIPPWPCRLRHTPWLSPPRVRLPQHGIDAAPSPPPAAARSVSMMSHPVLKIAPIRPALHGARLALGLVIGHQRRGLRLVHLQALADGLCVVVRAVRQRSAALRAPLPARRRKECCSRSHPGRLSSSYAGR